MNSRLNTQIGSWGIVMLIFDIAALFGIIFVLSSQTQQWFCVLLLVVLNILVFYGFAKVKSTNTPAQKASLARIISITLLTLVAIVVCYAIIYFIIIGWAATRPGGIG